MLLLSGFAFIDVVVNVHFTSHVADCTEQLLQRLNVIIIIIIIIIAIISVSPK